jgi:hypothetical protein
VKWSGRDESIQVVIHMCMGAMLGISLYSYPYLKLAKCYVFLIIAYVFSSTKLERRAEHVLRGRWGREGGGGGQGGDMTQTLYAHMNK